jgi:hypothetical protein
MTFREELLRKIARFCGRTGMSDSGFGLAVINDKNLVRQMREGRNPNAATIDIINRYIDVHSRKKHRRKKPAAAVAAE